MTSSTQTYIQSALRWGTSSSSNTISQANTENKHSMELIFENRFYASVLLLALLRTLHFKNSSIFCDIMPCSPLKVNRRFRRTCHLHLHSWWVSLASNRHVADSKSSLASTLKMDMTCSSETSADFQQTTWCYIPDNRTIHNHCRENLESYAIRIQMHLRNCKAFFRPTTDHFVTKERVVAGRHFQ
jgi:hypothetical protein